MNSTLYITSYLSPLGTLQLIASNNSLIGLYFENATYMTKNINMLQAPSSHPSFTQTRIWLESYFSHNILSTIPPLQLIGTPFMQLVWESLLKIPYGTTITYGELSKIVAKHMNMKKMSAQAIGGALKRNPIAIIVPCHRVVGRNGNLTGYRGGLKRKQFLLQLEKETLNSNTNN